MTTPHGPTVTPTTSAVHVPVETRAVSMGRKATSGNVTTQRWAPAPARGRKSEVFEFEVRHA